MSVLSMDSIIRTGIKPIHHPLGGWRFIQYKSQAQKSPVYETGLLQQQQQVGRH